MLAARLLLSKVQRRYKIGVEEGDRQVKFTGLNNARDSGFRACWKFLRAPEVHSPCLDLQLNVRVSHLTSLGENH